MAVTVIVINNTNESITQMVNSVNTPAFQERHATLSQVQNMLTRFNVSNAGTIQITVRDTDPAVATSGTGSIQFSV